ncbi:hypothetical protein FHS42_003448 [Streptomyces zagrosensis]|uniref:Uncharacterized protein n=1 Tax=Streptomyces zagrosensis TaxID=1042984 RepID=A0A7W9QAU8_9ACTN|nr:hypothetical protein [Streptomyces zagrosensis]
MARSTSGASVVNWGNWKPWGCQPAARQAVDEQPVIRRQAEKRSVISCRPLWILQLFCAARSTKVSFVPSAFPVAATACPVPRLETLGETAAHHITSGRIAGDHSEDRLTGAHAQVDYATGSHEKYICERSGWAF